MALARPVMFALVVRLDPGRAGPMGFGPARIRIEFRAKLSISRAGLRAFNKAHSIFGPSSGSSLVQPGPARTPDWIQITNLGFKV